MYNRCNRKEISEEMYGGGKFREVTGGGQNACGETLQRPLSDFGT